MMKKCATFSVAIIFFLYSSTICKEFIDSLFAFRAHLPDQWEIETIDSNSVYAYNTSNSTKTRIYLERISADTIAIIKQNELGRIYFLTNYSFANQCGVVQYFDTGSTVKQGNLKAYEMLAYYRDTMGGKTIWWGEFGRWCSQRNYVFQVIVLGDTLDVSENLDTYISMVDSISFWFPGLTTKANKNKCSQKVKIRGRAVIYTLSGKIISSNRSNRGSAAGCYVGNNRHSINIPGRLERKGPPAN
jgi:hypothetical protein